MTLGADVGSADGSLVGAVDGLYDVGLTEGLIVGVTDGVCAGYSVG